MSLLDKIQAFFSSGSGSAHQAAKRLYLLDAARISDEKANGSRIGPREQVQVLQQLARFAEQEKVRLIAVFEGRPLREVENGGEYNGITVYFAEQDTSVNDVLLKLLKSESRRMPVVVVTADAQLEAKVLASGGQSLRVSTFRKALSGGNGGGSMGGDRGDRGRPMNRRRHFRQRGGNGGRPNSSQQEGAAPSEQQSGGESSNAAPSSDPVRNLIDLVE
ncbi:MAG: hypothetical protein A2X46_17700 [Lentisphaerae bacterium GWF2_57_35]|nr:MAG: hypothetical protein A2X46_17700 [Lentisphaerae bacterium GWF2_57_35]